MCCSLKSCLKFVLITINVFILLAGGAALGCGVWIIVDQDSFFNAPLPAIDKEFLRYSAIVLSTGGAATVFFAVLGIAAAATTSSCLLGLYITVIALVIALEAAAVILGIVFKDAWEEGLDMEIINRLRTEYDPMDSKGFSPSMDAFQREHKCCGWRNGSDYEKTGSQWNRLQDDGKLAVLPLTCCRMINATHTMVNCTTVPTATNSFITQGCKSVMNTLFIAYQGCVIGFAAGIAGLEFLLLVLAVVLLINKRPNKYDMS